MNAMQTGGSLTAEQREFYDREGYVLIEGLLDDEDMRPAREAMMEKTEEIAADLLGAGVIAHDFRDEPFSTRLARLFDGLTDADFLKWGRGWRDRRVGYYRLMSNPKIIDAVESLIGPEIFSNPIYNVRPKVPGVAAGAVPWHQDKSYWPDFSNNPVITVWIPLVDSTHENGCLHLIPGTHKKRLIKHVRETYSSTGYEMLPDEHIRERKRDILALPMKAGSAVFFNDRLIHSSTPNNSSGVRWSVDLRYQPTDQDPMSNGENTGFLARSAKYPERVATEEDWLAGRLEHEAEAVPA